MISAILSALTFIPGILSLLQTWEKAKFDAKVAIYQARTGANRDVATAAIQGVNAQEHENAGRLAIIASNPLLAMMLLGFALPLMIFEWKVVVVDIVVGPGRIGLFGWTLLSWTGNTDPIRGQVAEWATTIIGFIFGTSGALALGKMWFSRNKSSE